MPRRAAQHLTAIVAIITLSHASLATATPSETLRGGQLAQDPQAESGLEEAVRREAKATGGDYQFQRLILIEKDPIALAQLATTARTLRPTASILSASELSGFPSESLWPGDAVIIGDLYYRSAPTNEVLNGWLHQLPRNHTGRTGKIPVALFGTQPPGSRDALEIASSVLVTVAGVRPSEPKAQRQALEAILRTLEDAAHTGLEETPAQGWARIVQQTMAVMEAASFLNRYGPAVHVERVTRDLGPFLTGQAALDQLIAPWPPGAAATTDAAIIATVHHFVPDSINSQTPDLIKTVVDTLSNALWKEMAVEDQDLAKQGLKIWEVKAPALVVAYAVATKRWLDLLVNQPQKTTPPLYVLGPECWDTPLAGLDGLSQFILVAKPTMTPNELMDEVRARHRFEFVYVGTADGRTAIGRAAQAHGVSVASWRPLPIGGSPTEDRTATLGVLSLLLADFAIPSHLWNPKDTSSDTKLRQYLKDLETRWQA